MNANELLQELRNQPGKREYYDNYLIMYKLLRYLDSRDILQLALDQVVSYAPVFEARNADRDWPEPERDWPNKWIAETSRFEPIDYSRHNFPMYVDEYDDPSSSRFIHAIQYLDSAFQAYFAYGQKAFENVVELAGGAIEYIGGAKMITYMLATASDATLRYYNYHDDPASVSIEESFEIARAFREHPERIRFIEQFFTELAEAIQQKLK